MRKKLPEMLKRYEIPGKRQHGITVRVTIEEREYLKAQAKEQGLTLAKYIMDLLLPEGFEEAVVEKYQGGEA